MGLFLLPILATGIWQNARMNRPSHSPDPASPALTTATLPATAPRPADGYTGDVSPDLAWQWVQSGLAVLVDVRSDAEREWVGFVPGAVPLAWKQWPGMAMNAGFDAGLCAAVPAGQKVVLLCRSGVRSIAAARRATELGLQAYNILEGFEGDPDAQGHRGGLGGWRQRGLPWRQN
jgi:rhodanese-related sulfurtransferase